MDDSDAAQTPTSTIANDLSTELSEADEAAFVDRIIGAQPTVKSSFDGNTASQPKESNENAENVTTPPTQEEKPTEVTPPPAPAAQAPEEEPVAPVEIAAPDYSDLYAMAEGMAVDEDGNATPKVFKISIETGGIPDDMHFKNDAQLAAALDELQDQKRVKADRQSEYEQQLEEQNQAKTTAENQQAQLDGWDAEIQQLIDANLLESPKLPSTDPNYLKDPTMQKVDEIFKFMIERNKELVAAGKKPIQSFGTVFNLYNNQQATVDAQAKAKEQDDLTKRRGGMVAGGSPASGGGKQKIYKAGSAKSIWNVDTSDI